MDGPCVGDFGWLGASVSSSDAVEQQLADPRGDIVATCADSAAAGSTDRYSESTEYGQARSASTAYSTYGRLGAKQRSADDLGGLIIMGARLYDPATGRFESVDPVSGGNANTYIYPDDPINQFDTNGQCWWGCHIWHHIRRWYHHVAAPILRDATKTGLEGFAGGFVVGCASTVEFFWGRVLGWRFRSRRVDNGNVVLRSDTY